MSFGDKIVYKLGLSKSTIFKSNLVHVCLVVPGLDVQEDGGLGDEGWLLGLLLVVGLQPLLRDPLLLLTLLFVGAAKNEYSLSYQFVNFMSHGHVQEIETLKVELNTP